MKRLNSRVRGLRVVCVGGLVSAAGLVGVLGCSSEGSSNGGSGGATGQGGSSANGGSTNPSGGKASGGTASGGQGQGGATLSGGAPGSGGSSAGASSGGAAPGSGGSTPGGRPGSGGSYARGGANSGGAGGGAGGAIAGQSNAGGSSPTAGQSNGGSGSGDTGKSAGCGKAPTIPSSQYNNGQPITISAGGMQRRFILSVPANYDNTHPYKLVVAYHQLDGNDKQLYSWQYYGLLPLSNNTTIFVAPNGQKNGAPCSGTGSGESGCGWPNSGDSDLALADAVVKQIEDNFCVDTNRIFATGWSYGGSMTYRTACSRPEGGTASWHVRAVAVYSGAQLSGNCTPSKAVAYFAEHGTNDTVLNYENMGLPLAQNFSKANGCTWATPTKITSGTHVCTNLAGCTTGYPVTFCSFNGGHTPFPDTGQQAGSWGPGEAWKFLNQF